MDSLQFRKMTPLLNKIQFNKPYVSDNEWNYLSQAVKGGQLGGDGQFTKKCHGWLESYLGCKKALLTHSCTGALEMSAILAGIEGGDEIIMPSFTFVSTANAFVLRGGVPVFVDIRPDTMNMDENLIEAAITTRTKAIVVVHYAGMACEMDTIMQIAKRNNLVVIEDAAQAIMSDYKGKKLGSIGHMATFSFHATKNLTSGEGGALIINEPAFAERAEVIWEKGTDRSKFLRGQVDKYSWVDLGSSCLPGELTAAFLWAQLEKAEEIISKRLRIWQTYDDAFRALSNIGSLTLPAIPSDCKHNAHMYYLLLKDVQERHDFIQYMDEKFISTATHYVPLHSSSFGKTCSRSHGKLQVTENIAQRLIRLPLWVGLEPYQEKVIEAVRLYIER